LEPLGEAVNQIAPPILAVLAVLGAVGYLIDKILSKRNGGYKTNVRAPEADVITSIANVTEIHAVLGELRTAIACIRQLYEALPALLRNNKETHELFNMHNDRVDDQFTWKNYDTRQKLNDLEDRIGFMIKARETDSVRFRDVINGFTVAVKANGEDIAADKVLLQDIKRQLERLQTKKG
jgi:hypothetical protein